MEKTPKEFFEKEAPAKAKPEKLKDINAITQINLSGPLGGSWTVIIKDQKLQITEGIHAAPTLTLKMQDKDFMDIVNGKISAEKAFFTGRVQFNGNISVALKLKDAGFL
jgi:putative sterol carrier protein